METDTTTNKSLVGQTLDNRYQIESIIGEGGMSTVYKARHLFLKRDVAVKVMQDHLAINLEGRLRFQREAQAAAALSHPNIIAVTEFGVSQNGEPYMVMDYLNGVSMAQMIKDKGRATPGHAIEIFKQVAAALQHAHEKGVVHRDLKPSNVMLVRSSVDNCLQVKVVDFGLARFMPTANADQRRLTAAGELVGSPFYMSPEQIKDEELDARSDIYALGCLMYEALTGTRPFCDTNAISVLSMHLYEAPPPFADVLQPCRIPPKVEAIVRKCLEKNRSKRYQTMTELASELELVSEWVDAPNAITITPPFPSEANKAGQRQKAAEQEAIKQAVAKLEPSARIPSISHASGTIDLPQYTLRMEKPEFNRNPVKDFLRNLANPFINMAKPHVDKMKSSFEGRGPEARKMRLSGTRVLIAVLGDSKEMIAAAEADAAKYAVYYKNVEQRKSMNAQEFLVLLSTDQFEIVHLHGKFDKKAIFKDSTGFALRLNDVKRACDYAQVKMLWLATENNLDWLKNNPVLNDPSFHLVLTASRGENFPKFLSSMLSRLSRGDLFCNAWASFVPELRAKGGQTNCRLVPGIADTAFLP